MTRRVKYRNHILASAKFSLAKCWLSDVFFHLENFEEMIHFVSPSLLFFCMFILDLGEDGGSNVGRAFRAHIFCCKLELAA